MSSRNNRWTSNQFFYGMWRFQQLIVLLGWVSMPLMIYNAWRENQLPAAAGMVALWALATIAFHAIFGRVSSVECTEEGCLVSRKSELIPWREIQSLRDKFIYLPKWHPRMMEIVLITGERMTFFCEHEQAEWMRQRL